MKIIKGMVTILGGLVLGLMAGFFIYKAVNKQTRVEMRFPVVVAAVDIAPGTVLQSNHLTVVQWPFEYLPPHSAYMFHQVEKRMASSPIAKGEPIMLPKLLPPSVKICPWPMMPMKTFPTSRG